MVPSLRKNSASASIKLNIRLPPDLALPRLDCIWEKWKPTSTPNICMSVCAVVYSSLSKLETAQTLIRRWMGCSHAWNTPQQWKEMNHWEAQRCACCMYHDTWKKPDSKGACHVISRIRHSTRAGRSRDKSQISGCQGLGRAKGVWWSVFWLIEMLYILITVVDM